MRPRILHELSRHLTERIERTLRLGDDEAPVPVLLCHPLDMLDERSASERATGVLYPVRLAAERARGRTTVVLEASPIPGEPAVVTTPPLWMVMRFVFLVVGGTQEDELGALAEVFRNLAEHPWVALSELGLEDDEAHQIVPFSYSRSVDARLPIRLVDDPLVWREIGLEEHRLFVVFEVSAPVSSPRREVIEPIVERDLDTAVDAETALGGTPRRVSAAHER